jgi:hypothetical protein
VFKAKGEDTIFISKSKQAAEQGKTKDKEN